MILTVLSIPPNHYSTPCPMDCCTSDPAEIRFGLMAALRAGQGRIISEVGASIMPGDNTAHYRRNISSVIAFETSKGAFAEGIAPGIDLSFLALMVNALLQYAQGKGSINP